MVEAFLAIVLATIAGAFVSGFILQYLTRNVIKSASIGALIALTITSMQVQQGFTRTFYHLLFTLINIQSFYSYLFLLVCGFVGASISRYFFKGDCWWGNVTKSTQGAIIGFFFGFMSYGWFKIFDGFYLSLIVFGVAGYLLGRLLVGRTINRYTLTFFNIFLILLIIIGTAHAIHFEVVKKQRQNFLDEYFTKDAPIGPYNLPIDTVSSFGGEIYFENSIPIHFSVSEGGTDYENMENLYPVVKKYIKTLPALSETQIINDRRLRYEYDGKKQDVFFKGVVPHPKDNYTYITVKYTYNTKVSEKTQRTLEFLKTHINPMYLPTDLESHIVSGNRYLRGELGSFVAKQYTGFDENDSILFVFEMWKENASTNEKEAYQLAKSIIKTMPEDNVDFIKSSFEHEFDRFAGLEKTTQFKTIYAYNDKEYEISILSRYTKYHAGSEGGYYPILYLKEA